MDDDDQNTSDQGPKKEKRRRLVPKSETHLEPNRGIASVHFRFKALQKNRNNSAPNVDTQANKGPGTDQSEKEGKKQTENASEIVDVQIEIAPDVKDASEESSEEIVIRPLHTLSLVSVNLNDQFETPAVSSAISSERRDAVPDMKDESPYETLSRLSKTRTNSCLPSVNSSITIGGRRCRICMSTGPERLISPCHCKGSLGVMHVSCLERWLSTSGRASCELCGYRFPVVMTQRYSTYRALIIWLRFSRNRTTFMTDCLFFWTLTVLSTSLTVCCIMGSRYFDSHSSIIGLPRGLATAMTNVLLTVVLFGYVLTTYVLWKDHAVLWRRWRMATMDIRLALRDLSHQSDGDGGRKSSETKT